MRLPFGFFIITMSVDIAIFYLFYLDPPRNQTVFYLQYLILSLSDHSLIGSTNTIRVEKMAI